MSVLVLTVDQRDSRRGSDQVPTALGLLGGVPVLRSFERTAGDELQGVLDDPAALPAAVEPLLRAGSWSVGVGVGPVDLPLPPHARAGAGPAYLHARAGVTAAKTSPWHLRVVGEHPGARQLESALWLWAAVLARRTPRGWEVADLTDAGLSYDETARRLGISQSAVSQRAQAAGLVDERRARNLARDLLAEMLVPGKETS